jgi:threonine dehydratase
VRKEYVDEMVLVDTDAICAAIKDVFEDTRSILEPAGALAMAGAKAWAKHKLHGKTLVAVASGANMNFDRLRFVAERAEVGEQREAVLAVTIPETPGSFREILRLLGKRNITEFNYRYADPGRRTSSSACRWAAARVAQAGRTLRRHGLRRST